MNQIDVKALGIKLAAAMQQVPSVAANLGVPPIKKVAPPAGAPPAPGAAAPAPNGMPPAAAPAPAAVPPSPHAQAAGAAIAQPTAADIMTPQGAQQTYGGKGLVPSENVVGNQIAQKVAQERLEQTAQDVLRRGLFATINPLLFR